jgi:hypothetical protein
MHPPVASADRLLRIAIAERRLVTFSLDGFPRIAEPHDYGIKDGEARLFFYQRGGASRSGRPVGWRWAALPKIWDLQILHDTFPGPRPVPSGRHVHWDTLIATVSPRPTSPQRHDGVPSAGDDSTGHGFARGPHKRS